MCVRVRATCVGVDSYMRRDSSLRDTVTATHTHLNFVFKSALYFSTPTIEKKYFKP